ncbi:hypothetical protein L7F22_046078 [Adiantum nelumboides]|nr:hypothetical protein [Adiantum nelumboides]
MFRRLDAVMNMRVEGGTSKAVALNNIRDSVVDFLKDFAHEQAFIDYFRTHWVTKVGALEKDLILGNALVDMYVKCGVLLEAQNAFDELTIRDVVSWTALIAGYAQQGQGKEALGCFQRMLSENFSPNAITYVCILRACGIMQDVDVGKQIHDEIVHQGLLKKNVVVGNALIDMYAKCGVLLQAQQVFNELSGMH